MSETRSARRWAIPALIYCGLWILVALAFAGQSYLAQAKRGGTVSWSATFAGSLADWAVFAVLSLPAIALAKRFHLGGKQWQLRLVLHIVASAVFSLLWMLARAVIERFLPGRDRIIPLNELLRYILVATFFFNVIVYWVVLTGTHAVAYYRNFREREIRVMELEGRLATAQLQALRMQLNPHFLFNALNGIGTLMYRDVDAADSMLVKLSDLLRQALDQSHRPLLPLREELAFLRRYVELEQMRFGSRLRAEWSIASETLDVQVPAFLLQPLVENSLKHGLEPRAVDHTELQAFARLALMRIGLRSERRRFEGDARNAAAQSDALRELFTVDERRANHLEGHVRAASDGDPGGLEQTDRGVQHDLLDGSQVRRRTHPPNRGNGPSRD